MDNLECPNCHQKTIPASHKMRLGPATSIVCPACGARISVPYWSLVALIPFLLAIGASYFAAVVAGSIVATAPLLPIGFAAMWWLHSRYVPLIVKK